MRLAQTCWALAAVIAMIGAHLFDCVAEIVFERARRCPGGHVVCKQQLRIFDHGLQVGAGQTLGGFGDTPQVRRGKCRQIFNLILLGIFSELAMLLATTAIYGVLSYSMSRRTSEIGPRVALGASGRSILGMTIVQGMRPVLVGLAPGAVGAWRLSRYFTTLLFGISPLRQWRTL